MIFASTASRREQPHAGDRRRNLCPGPDPARRLAGDRRRASLRQLQARRRTICARRAPTSAASDELLSPRLGLILKPADNLSLYASYSRSYLPQSGDQFSGLTSTTRELKPERFDNYRDRREVGADRRPARDRRRLSARPHQHARARSGRRQRDRPDRRAAQQGHRARARAEHQRPLAGLGRLCAAEGGDHQDHGRRARGPRRAVGARATASRCGTATT